MPIPVSIHFITTPVFLFSQNVSLLLQKLLRRVQSFYCQIIRLAFTAWEFIVFKF